MAKIDAIEKKLLKKLLFRRRINTYHIRWNTVLKCGWKSHQRGEVKRAIKSLVKKGYIQWVKKNVKALSLNKDKLAEIRALCGVQPRPLSKNKKRVEVIEMR